MTTTTPDTIGIAAGSPRPSARTRFGIAFLVGLVAALLLGAGALYAYDQQYAGRILPGVSIGSVQADEDGNFELLALGPQREVSAVQGEAIVHLESDTALQTAFDTVLEQARAQAAAD